MGLLISKIPPKPKKLVMVGLDAAGKTTILYKLKCETVQLVPHYSIEKSTYKNLELTIFDLGGGDNIRAQWRHFYKEIDGAIFVVDSLDKERCEEAAGELQRMSLELTADKPILIFANKQDFKGTPNFMNLEEIKKGLRVETLKQKSWHIQPCCAIRGNGLEGGFNWINGACQS